ncbi:hypothetical protein [Rickettsia bellii]|uniref:Uncharacterized protein n=1 Tax=Rickettsia bellii str. RML An4 TaxID=1359193 RepID=A0A0F3QEW4_RICBE|nr:hypothetical protein [Rickettsia bellii]KJV89989.1 hypothetical protein RBEAN4_0985 [Rickettsia bellii str. RML An4]
MKWYLDNPNVDTDIKAQAIKLVLSKGSNIAIDLDRRTIICLAWRFQKTF